MPEHKLQLQASDNDCLDSYDRFEGVPVWPVSAYTGEMPSFADAGFSNALPPVEGERAGTHKP